MTVVLRLPKRSICAPPRKPTSMKPRCRQYWKTSGIEQTPSAPATSAGSPMEMGRRAGRARRGAGPPQGEQGGGRGGGPRADGAGLIDEHEVRAPGAAGEVDRQVGDADADKHRLAVLEHLRRRRDHNLPRRVVAHA